MKPTEVYSCWSKDDLQPLTKPSCKTLCSILLLVVWKVPGTLRVQAEVDTPVKVTICTKDLVGREQLLCIHACSKGLKQSANFSDHL